MSKLDCPFPGTVAALGTSFEKQLQLFIFEITGQTSFIFFLTCLHREAAARTLSILSLPKHSSFRVERAPLEIFCHTLRRKGVCGYTGGLTRHDEASTLHQRLLTCPQSREDIGKPSKSPSCIS